MAEGGTVLVTGAAGTFGTRLVEALLTRTEFGVIAAARTEARVSALRARIGRAGSGRLSSLVLDTGHATPELLRATGAFAVVDASGPYQGGLYGLAQAAISAGLHYVDLADGRDWVAGFSPALDSAARAAGVTAVTGASSTPALSNAALDRITMGWRRVDRVAVAISPGNRAPRGLSVVRSILSYAGRDVRVLENGAWRNRPGWGMTVRCAMPGLGRRWLGLVDTPDLDLIPQRYPELRTALFRAGLELSVLHLSLLLATLLVRAGLLRSLAPLARPLRAAAALLESFGRDYGGMTVEAEGTDGAGQPIRSRWWLLAEGGDGLYVPTLPAVAVLRILQAGGLPRGAGPCVGMLPLKAIAAEFSDYRIRSGIETERPSRSVYETVLGEGFETLPGPMRSLHRPGWGKDFGGLAKVERGAGVLAKVIAGMLALPRAAEEVPVHVSIVREASRERWTRRFGDRRFITTVSAGAAPGRLLERVGPLTLEYDLKTSPEGIDSMQIVRWRAGPIALPTMVAPECLASECVDEQRRFRFDVELRLPLGLGRLVRYHGWLVPGGAVRHAPTRER